MTHIPDLSGDTFPSVPQIEVHTDGVAQLLSNIRVNKAGGPDNLPACFLKEVALYLCMRLHLFSP